MCKTTVLFCHVLGQPPSLRELPTSLVRTKVYIDCTLSRGLGKEVGSSPFHDDKQAAPSSWAEG